MKSLKLLVVGLLLLAFGTASAQTFTSDPAHTHVVWRADHLGISYTFGRFNEIMATLEYDAANPEEGSIEFSILTESVDSVTERRDDHLRSPDFFDAAQFPTIDFASKNITAVDDTNFEVVGDLTVHGVTQEVTLNVEKTGEGQNQNGDALVGFYTEFTIDRTEYGMNNLLQATGPEILIMASFEGVAQ